MNLERDTMIRMKRVRSVYASVPKNVHPCNKHAIRMQYWSLNSLAFGSSTHQINVNQNAENAASSALNPSCVARYIWKKKRYSFRQIRTNREHVLHVMLCKLVASSCHCLRNRVLPRMWTLGFWLTDLPAESCRIQNIASCKPNTRYEGWGFGMFWTAWRTNCRELAFAQAIRAIRIHTLLFALATTSTAGSIKDFVPAHPKRGPRLAT
jgi:hypothetical protein